MLTLLCVKHQVLRADLHTVVGPLRTHASMHMAQTQRQQVGTQTRLHSVQGHICGDAHRLTLANIRPQAQGTTAVLQRQALVHWHPLTQGGQVHKRQVGKRFARPF